MVACSWIRTNQQFIDTVTRKTTKLKNVKTVKHWQLLSDTFEPCTEYVLCKKKLCQETLLSIKAYCSMICGFLSPQHGASSGCGGRIGLQIRSVAASVLNKLSRRTDRGWYSRFVSGEVLTSSHRVNLWGNEVFRKASDSDLFGWW